MDANTPEGIRETQETVTFSVEAAGEKTGEIIYALLDENGAVFYVGRTCVPRNRLQVHRLRFGAAITMRTLQADFHDESPSSAEKRWIRTYSAMVKLANIVHTDNPPIRHSRPLPKREGGRHIVVRGVNQDLWEAMRRWADRRGRNVRSVLDEMLSDWLVKTRKLATKRKQ